MVRLAARIYRLGKQTRSVQVVPAVSETFDPEGRRRPTRRIPILGAVLFGIAALSWLQGGDGEAVAAEILAEAGLAPVDPHTVIIAGTAMAALVGWAALYLLWGRGGWLDAQASEEEVARRPLSYADLGPPPPREQPLPTDLDQPLSAYDPEALLPGVRRR